MKLNPAVELPLLILATVLKAWALTLLWSWFVVPLFEAPPLTIPYAIGLLMVIGYATKPFDPFAQDDRTEEQKRTLWKWRMATPFIVVGFAWLVTLFT